MDILKSPEKKWSPYYFPTSSIDVFWARLIYMTSSIYKHAYSTTPPMAKTDDFGDPVNSHVKRHSVFSRQKQSLEAVL